MNNVRLLLIPLIIALLQGCVPVAAVGLVGVGFVMTRDQRQGGVMQEDTAIQRQTIVQITKRYPKGVHVNVASYNQNALITGEVPSETIRAEIGNIVAAQPNVRIIHNELAIAQPSSMSSRAADGLITSNVRLAMLHSKKIDAGRIRAVTEDGTVYLLGRVKHTEAAAASEAASTVTDVRFVIMLFEYLD